MRIHTQEMRSHSCVALFIAALITLIALVALVPLKGAGQSSGNPLAASLLPSVSASSQGAQPLLPGASNARRPPLSRHRSNGAYPAMAIAAANLFLPAVTYDSGVGSPISVAIEDLNGDGKPDLVVTNYCGNSDCNDSTVGVLLGNGDGTFRPAGTYDLGNYPATSMAVADVNGDGKADIVVTVDVYLSVLLGNGDGTFQPPVAYDPGGCVQVAPCANGVAIADVNGDGKPDLVVSNTYSRTVGVLLGKGDGTFETAVTYGTGGSGPISVAVADLDGDGKLDIAVTNDCAFNSNVSCAPGEMGTVGVLLGNGDGTFRKAVIYASGGLEPWSVAVADVNGDGKPDLVVSNCGQIHSCAEGYAGVAGVLLGNGDGTFQPAVTYDSGGGGAMSVAVADVNGDGKPDLLVGNRCADSCFKTLIGGVGVLLGNGDGTFQAAEIYDSGGAVARSIAVADVNRDGEPDLAVANSGYLTGSSVGVLLHAGNTPTGTKLTSNPNPAVPGQTVTYTADVTNQSGKIVTGTVAFWDGAVMIATVGLIGNHATYSIAYKGVGTHAITATYSGDVHNASSVSAVLTEKVTRPPFPTNTAVATSGSPSFIGQSVTFTVTVTCGTHAIPDGELVTFYDGTTTLGSTALAGGTAAFTTSALSKKTHTIKASYGGDVMFMPSAGTVTQVVEGFSTTSSLSSNLNPSIYGQKVTWTATVTSSGPVTPTGKVKFTWGDDTIGIAALNRGVGTITRLNLNASSLPLTAVYSGDAMNQGSTSSPLNQVVLQTTSTATISSSPNPSVRGQVVTFTAKITSPTVIPKGPVIFTAGKTVLGTAQLSGGVAKLTISSLAVGSTKVTATYYGDSNISQSTASVTQTVH